MFFNYGHFLLQTVEIKSSNEILIEQSGMFLVQKVTSSNTFHVFKRTVAKPDFKQKLGGRDGKGCLFGDCRISFTATHSSNIYDKMATSIANT